MQRKLRIGDYISANPFTDKVIEPEDTRFLLANREREKERIDYVIASAEQGFPQNIAILGEIGMGKSSMLNYIQAQCQIKKGIYFSRINVTEDTSEEILVKSMVRDLLDQVHIGLGRFLIGMVGLGRKEQTKEIEKRIKGIHITKASQKQLSDPILRIISISTQVIERKGRPEDIFEVLQLMKELMNMIRKDVKTIAVLFDEGGYVAKEKSIALLQRMKLIFQNKPFMLCIGGSPTLFSEYGKIESTFPNLFLPHNRLALSPLDIQGIRELIQKRLTRVRVVGKDIEPFSEEAIQTILNESEGNPRRIVGIAGYSLYLSRGKAGYIEPADVVEASGSALTILGGEAFDRLKKDLQEICLIIGKYPNSTFEQIRKYLGRTTKSEISKSTISPKINELQKLGYIGINQIGREKRCFLKGLLQKYYNQIVHE